MTQKKNAYSENWARVPYGGFSQIQSHIYTGMSHLQVEEHHRNVYFISQTKEF